MTGMGATLRLQPAPTGQVRCCSWRAQSSGPWASVRAVHGCSSAWSALRPVLPLASRIALRDTARARSRNGPIVTALLASFAATVALAAYMASVDATNAARWTPWLARDQIFIQGEGAATAGPEAAETLGAIAAAPIPGVGDDHRIVWLARGDGNDVNLGIQNITVGDAALLKALGAEAATSDLLAGSAILLSKDAETVTRVTAHVQDGAGAEIERMDAPGALHRHRDRSRRPAGGGHLGRNGGPLGHIGRLEPAVRDPPRATRSRTGTWRGRRPSPLAPPTPGPTRRSGRRAPATASGWRC